MRERLTLMWWAMSALLALLIGSVLWYVVRRPKGPRRPGASPRPLRGYLIAVMGTTAAGVSLAIPLLIVARAFGGPAFVAGLAAWWVALIVALGWIEDRATPGTGQRLIAVRATVIATVAVATVAIVPYVLARTDRTSIAGAYLATVVFVVAAAVTAALWGRVWSERCDRRTVPVALSLGALVGIAGLSYGLVSVTAVERYQARDVVHDILDPYGPGPANPERMALIAPSDPPTGATSTGEGEPRTTASDSRVGERSGPEVVAACRAADLRAIAHGWDAATGWRAVAVTVQNATERDCWLRDRPRLVVTDDGVSVIAKTEAVVTDASGTPVSERRITIGPGDSASVELGWRGTGVGAAPSQRAALDLLDESVPIDLSGGFFDIDPTTSLRMSPWIEAPANKERSSAR